MAEPLVSIRGLSNSYVSRSFGPFGKKEIKPVLNNVNLEIAAGEIVGLTGESGCGKTTLARCILGLIGYEGEIYIKGRLQRSKSHAHCISLSGKNFTQRHGDAKIAEKNFNSHISSIEVNSERNEMFSDNSSAPLRLCEKKFGIKHSLVQTVFQDPGASLNPAIKIGRLLEEPLVIHRFGTAKQREIKVDETLARVGLDPSYKKRRVHELSGGQKQRVCIGRSLILDPEILIADEAANSLDVSAGAQILNLLNELRQNSGLAVLFISHNTDAVEYLCDRVAVMQEGRIVKCYAL